MLLMRIEFEDVYSNSFGGLTELREAFAGLVSSMVRDTDTIGWLEDGCLAVLLRAVTAADTTLVATRLQRQIARRPIMFGARNVYVAVQIGGVWTSGDNPMPIDDFTEQAWVAMLS
jgi:GGDEF domain-containing protein